MVTVDPEIRKVPRRADDKFLILACDGIWDCLSSEECGEKLSASLAARDQSKPIS